MTFYQFPEPNIFQNFLQLCSFGSQIYKIGINHSGAENKIILDNEINNTLAVDIIAIWDNRPSA